MVRPAQVGEVFRIVAAALGEKLSPVVDRESMPAGASGNFASALRAPLHELLDRDRNRPTLCSASAGSRADDLGVASSHRSDPRMDLDALSPALRPGPIALVTDRDCQLERRSPVI